MKSQLLGTLLLLTSPLVVSSVGANDILPDGDWIRIEAEDVAIVGNADENTALRMGRQVEQLRRFLDLFLGSGEPSRHPPLRMVLFRKTRHFAPYVPQRGDDAGPLGGWYASTPQGDFMAVDASREETQLAILFHELVHGWLNTNLPHAPLWLQEGLAEVFSTFRLHDGTAEVGRALPWHLKTLREKPLMSADELRSVTHTHADYADRERGMIYYAQCWALVHSLFTEKKTADAFPGYLQRLRAGVESDEAFPAAFGAPLSAFMGEMDRYARRKSVNVFRLPMMASPTWKDRSARRLGEAEALLELGELLAALPSPRPGLAERHFQRALELGAAANVVDRARAMSLHEQGRTDEAIAALEHALAVDGDDMAAHVHLGSLLVERWYTSEESQRVDPREDPPEDLLRAAEHFRSALALRPDDPQALAGLGTTALASDDPSTGIAPLERAVIRMPWRTDLVAHLAVLHALTGEPALARKKIDGQLRGRAPREEIQWAESAVIESVTEEVADLIAEDRLEEGQLLLRELLEWVQEPESIRWVEENLDSYREMLIRVERERAAHESRAAEFDRYNEAVDLARQERYEEARARAIDLRAETADPQLQEAVEELVDQLDEQIVLKEVMAGYDRAVEMVREDRLGEARRLLRDLLRRDDLPLEAAERLRGFLDQLMGQR